MSRVIVRITLFLASSILAGPAASAGVDEAAAGRDLVAALAPPCWQPVFGKSAGGLPGMMGMSRSALLEPWEAPATLAAARALARRYGEDAVPFWERRAREAKDYPERGLALATLVALSDRPAGADALAKRLFDTKSLTESVLAFSLITDLHGPGARPILERLVADACGRLRAKTEAPVRFQNGTVLSRAGELLGAVGDQRTRVLLRGLLAQGGDKDPSAQYLKRVINALEARLAQPEAEQAAWAREAVEFAKARWLHEGTISAQNGAYRSAGRLVDRGVRLGVPFLRFQLSAGPSDLAVAVAGNQREAALVPDLVRVAERRGGGYNSSMAFAALGQIGTPLAIDALLALVRRGLDLRIAVPLSILAKRGDATTLKSLQRLATDPSFSAADQADIAAARDYLAARLAGKTPAPASMMGDGGPQFPPR